MSFLRFGFLALFLVTGACSFEGQGSSGNNSPGDTDQRGPIGKADLVGSCAQDDGGDFCGGQSDGNCWCDSLCPVFDDCCGDVEETCDEPTGPIFCTPGGDECPDDLECDPNACVPSCPLCEDCNAACVVPKSDDPPLCCSLDDKPGENGNSFCFEGATCCANGEWQCNSGNGSSTCDGTADACEETNCCSLDDKPGENGNPFCFEGATCCGDGTWQCNSGNGQPTCDAKGEACEKDNCCEIEEQPGFNGNPFCFEGATCCGNGKWQCNLGNGQPSCEAAADLCPLIECAGFLGLQCPDDLKCVDFPFDSCDPQNGGADCGGVCVAKDA